MAYRNYQNAVTSITRPSVIMLISDVHTEQWCTQYTQEGYDVYHLASPLDGADFQKAVSEIAESKRDFAVITYGLQEKDINTLATLTLPLADNLKAYIHYCPLTDNADSLLSRTAEGNYIPSTFHLASAQEKLHASLLPFTNPSSFLLEKKLSPTQFSPIIVYTYPLVPLTPAFPLLVTAPATIVPGQASNVDPYILSANNLAYTRTLELLRREIGPRFDLEKIWNEHIYYEFEARDARKTMSTMVKVPYVNHIPTLTGGVGYDHLARFYKHHFTSTNVTPPDTEIITISRTIGADRIIDEMILKCTHTTMIDYFIPGVKPTGKSLELALVGVIAFRGDKLCFEHIYWDQASVLVQLGLLDPKNLPVAGKEVANKVLDPYGVPSNLLMERWKESEGLSIE